MLRELHTLPLLEALYDGVACYDFSGKRDMIVRVCALDGHRFHLCLEMCGMTLHADMYFLELRQRLKLMSIPLSEGWEVLQ